MKFFKNFSGRRNFIKKSALGAGLLSSLSPFEIFIRTDGPIKSPMDLNGKKIGTTGYSWSSLPWYGQEHEDTKRAMGVNFWPYGMDANRKTLETICRYCFEQGLIKKQINYEDMFFPGSMAFSE